jgi:MSHA biogenesis protein MshI
VRSWGAFALDKADAAALRRLRGQIRGHCSTLLNHGQYQLLQTEAPAVPRAEMAAALRWRVKDMVDFPVDQAGIDVLPIPADGAPGRAAQVYVVAASHGVLTPMVRLFQDARLTLDAIDIPELAQRNIAALFETERRGLAMLAFDARGGRLTFTYGGELYITRHIEVSATELAQAAGDAIGGLFERVLLDVQRSLDNFDRNYNAITLSKVLVVPVPGAPGFADYLKGNLYQPVETLDLAAVLDLGQVPSLTEPKRQAEALLAIGAALRVEGP